MLRIRNQTRYFHQRGVNEHLSVHVPLFPLSLIAHRNVACINIRVAPSNAFYSEQQPSVWARAHECMYARTHACLSFYKAILLDLTFFKWPLVYLRLSWDNKSLKILVCLLLESTTEVTVEAALYLVPDLKGP